jgi:tetratricopeptide (TPR) repeat protein
MGFLTRPFQTKSSFWFPLILIAVGFLAYANSFACPFLFDDSRVITNNPALFHLWPPWMAVRSATRCVVDYSFALNYAWAGFSPAEYRLVNILIHIGTGLLLYGVMRRTLLLPRWNSQFTQSAPGLALATSLLWIIHPLQTESVTYIAQRIEAMMGFFFLLTFYCFIRAAFSRHARAWLSAAVAVCTVGMGTKEVMVAAPILLFLYDGIFIAPSWGDLVRKRGKLHALFFSTWFVFFGLLVMGIVSERSETISLFSQGINRWNYALTQLNVLAHYLKLTLIPHPLCLDYLWPLVNSPLEALWPGALILLLAGWTVWALYRRSWTGFIGAWFFIILAPTSSINPLPDAAFEHRMYLPLASLLAFLVMAVYQGLSCGLILKKTSRQQINRFAFGILGIAAMTFGILTPLRNEAYRSEESMWKDVLLKRPDNFRTYIALSTAYLAEQRYSEAAPLCRNLLTRLPDFSGIPIHEIERKFTSPGHQSIQLYYSMAHNNLGVVDLNSNQLDAATKHFREAIRVWPGADWGYRNLGHALYSENRLDEAITEWNRGLEIQPGDSLTHALLGVALSQKHQYKDAIGHFEQAIRIKPDFWFARSQWAWILATCPSHEVRNGRQAILIATPLTEIAENQSPKALDIVAAAYAEAGDFSNAVKYAKRAVDLSLINKDAESPSKNPAYTTETLLLRLNLYRTGQPYRE